MLLLRPGNITVTGSFSVTSGSLTDFIVTNNGTIKGNAVTDTHIATGSVSISGSSHTTIGNLALTGSLSVSGSVSANKIIGNSTTPTMLSGSGAGSTSAATISITGSDAAGIIRILTGTVPTAKSGIVDITFSSAYSSLPYVLVTPASYSSSLSLGGVSGTFSTASSTGFTIFSGDGALRPSTAYSWSYHVFG